MAGNDDDVLAASVPSRVSRASRKDVSEGRVGSAWVELIRAEQNNRRLGHENLGSLSTVFGFVPAQPPRTRLPGSHRAWDDVAVQLPQLHTDMAVRTVLSRMPVLGAGPDALPVEALQRAATVLGILGHAYGHMHTTATADLPASIAVPWARVRQRLGRGPEPVLSYPDLIVNNWRTVDPAATPALRLANLRLLVPAFDNQEERIFYLTQLEILARCAPIVVNVARAQHAVLTRRWEDAHEALSVIATVLTEVNTRSLKLIDPRPGSATFVDPVVWAKTVAPFAVPLTPGVLGPSGTASPIINLLDAFFGRDQHTSQLGTEILAHRRSYPLHWRRFIAAVGQTPIHAHLTSHAAHELLDQLEAAREAYAGPDGFLGRHRRKVYGYITVGFTVGRAMTIGGFSGSPRQRRWNDVDSALTASQTERPAAGGRREVALGTMHGVDKDVRGGNAGGPPVHPEDLLEHNDAEHGWWIAVDGRVFDLTDFIRRHPGGAHILRAHAGLDATEAFHRAHRHPDQLGLLRRSLDVGCLEPPAQHQSAALEAAYALVELQNTLGLDRSFGAGTRLCTIAGLAPSALQIDRATNTLDRFHEQYLPELISGALQYVKDVNHAQPPGRPTTGQLSRGSDEAADILRRRFDRLERWMATIKSDLLTGIRVSRAAANAVHPA